LGVQLIEAWSAQFPRSGVVYSWYPSEVLIGDTVVIRARLLARSANLLHYLMFMVNETRGVLSSLFECVHAHADLRTRRTAPSRLRWRPRSTPSSPPTAR
jgi:hypothetical protein